MQRVGGCTGGGVQPTNNRGGAHVSVSSSVYNNVLFRLVMELVEGLQSIFAPLAV